MISLMYKRLTCRRMECAVDLVMLNLLFYPVGKHTVLELAHQLVGLLGQRKCEDLQ